MSTNLYTEHRCPCGKLLCKGFIRDGEIEIKCKRCGVVSVIRGEEIVALDTLRRQKPE